MNKHLMEPGVEAKLAAAELELTAWRTGYGVIQRYLEETIPHVRGDDQGRVPGHHLNEIRLMVIGTAYSVLEARKHHA